MKALLIPLLFVSLFSGISIYVSFSYPTGDFSFVTQSVCIIASAVNLRDLLVAAFPNKQ